MSGQSAISSSQTQILMASDPLWATAFSYLPFLSSQASALCPLQDFLPLLTRAASASARGCLRIEESISHGKMRRDKVSARSMTWEHMACLAAPASWVAQCLLAPVDLVQRESLAMKTSEKTTEM